MYAHARAVFTRTRDAQVFCSSPCRQSHWCQVELSSCMYTATVLNLTSVEGAWPQTQKVSVRGHAPAWLSEWEQWLCPISYCFPINIIGIACLGMNETPVHPIQINTALAPVPLFSCNFSVSITVCPTCSKYNYEKKIYSLLNLFSEV